MVMMLLWINAELKNLTNLQPQDGCDDPYFAYYFKLKCGNCGEMSPKETCLIMSEKVPLPNSRGAETNLVQKCKFCGRDGSITMIPGRGRPLEVDEDGNTSFTPLMQFECRGSLEPVGFSFGRGWKATSIHGTVFEHIDLSGGDFADYCEKKEGAPVMITKPKYKLQIVKSTKQCYWQMAMKKQYSV